MTTEERLEKLEKDLAGAKHDLAKAKRRSRLLLVGAVAIVALVFLLGAGNDAVQNVVRAHEFDLVDFNGQSVPHWV